MTTQNVACPTTIVNSPKSTPSVTNDVRSAMPDTTPGSAIGSTRRNEIVWRPKNEYRCTARAASVPKINASTVAADPASNEFTTARETAAFAAASSNQRSVNPTGGHDWMRLSLKA